MSHEALGKTAKGKSTYPNVWFVGVTPRRNPELVVAVLWQNGEFSYYPARIGAKLVSAYVEKQRRLANNLAQPAKSDKPDTPAEMTGVWTNPDSGSGANDSKLEAHEDRVESGSFLVGKDGEIVARTAPSGAPRNPVLKGRGGVPSGSRAESSLKGGPALAAEGMRVGDDKSPPGRKPHASASASTGAPKGAPFQSKGNAPSIATAGKGR
jgi:hypothetical protein